VDTANEEEAAAGRDGPGQEAAGDDPAGQDRPPEPPDSEPAAEAGHHGAGSQDAGDPAADGTPPEPAPEPGAEPEPASEAEPAPEPGAGAGPGTEPEEETATEAVTAVEATTSEPVAEAAAAGPPTGAGDTTTEPQQGAEAEVTTIEPVAGPEVETPPPPVTGPEAAAPAPAAPEAPARPPEEPREPRPSRAPWVILALGIMVVIGVLAFVVTVAVQRGGPGPEPARAEAEAFVRAWSAGDTVAMQALVDPPTVAVADDLTAALGGLPVTRTTVTLVPGLLAGQGDDRTANVTIELAAPDLPPITYAHTIPFHKVAEDTWRVRWSRAVIHPALAPDRKFDRIRTWAPRATLQDINGQPIATTPGAVNLILRPNAVTDLPALKQALTEHLDIDAATVDKAVTASRATGRATIKTVPRAEYVGAKEAIYNIPGLSFEDVGGTRGIGGVIESMVLGTTGPASPEQAALLGPPYKEGDEIGVSGLQASQQKTLGGLPATEVRIVDGTGNVVQPIVKVDGSPPTTVRTTIDPAIQVAAQAALDGGAKGRSGALVVVDRSGAIRALANTATTGTNWATAQYAPGSTFKVITAAALLAHGVGPDTQLTCPPTIIAGGQPFRNFEGETEASLTFTRAFAISCNTAFLGATKQLNDQEMMKAAGQFGFNVDYDVGIPMRVKGSFPDEAGAIRAAQAIGQGKVLTNPLHMASVAAAAMTGQWRAPTFLANPPADRPVGAPLDPGVREQLTGFMRANVEIGSGTAAAAPGKVVYGKTGTAEQLNNGVMGTHAWYMGFSGDLAVAVVLYFGGVGGRDAAPIVGKFFSSV
jgi:cell division protein FtsI/penicillin-binding protein 2